MKLLRPFSFPIPTLCLTITIFFSLVFINLFNLNKKGINSFEIKKLAVDGTSGTILLANERLQPVTRALMYDTTGFRKEAKIIETYSPEQHIAKG